MLTLKNAVVVMLAMSSSMALADILALPDEANRWSISAAALYLQPSFGGNGLGYSSFSNYGTDFFGNQLEVNGAPNHLSNIHPKRAWDFQLEGAYRYGVARFLIVNLLKLCSYTK